jgi:Flp pilus assembly protein TadD
VLSRLVWEKVPLLGLSAISCIITYVAQGKGKAISSLDIVPLGYRVSNALVSYAAYLWKAVWPASLAVFYPHPSSLRADVPAWEVVGAVLFLGGVSFLVLREGERRPYLAVGWLWYLGTLVPVIGLVQVGSAALADRYTYVPLIGVFIAAAWGIPGLLSRWRWRRLVLWVSGGTIVVAFSVAAWVQAGYWRDNFTLYSRAVAVTQKNWMALTNLGVVYEESGKPQEAVTCYQEALRIRPDFAEAWINLGVSYNALGQYQQAIGYFQEVLRIRPDFAEAWYNLGVSYGKLGQYQQAIPVYQEALRIKPDYVEAWNNLGMSYGILGQYQQAIEYFQEALRIKPDYAVAWSKLGVAYEKLGQSQQAIGSFREALRIKPDYVEAWNNMGISYGKLGRRKEAEDSFREAGRLKGR